MIIAVYNTHNAYYLTHSGGLKPLPGVFNILSHDMNKLNIYI